MSRRKFIGVRERLQMLEEQEASDPWLARKFSVGLVIGIVSYVYYVYVVRVCIRMIERKRHRLGGRGTGIALISIFHVLLLFFIWSYLKIVVTSPGDARDHVPQSTRPQHPSTPEPSLNPDRSGLPLQSLTQSSAPSLSEDNAGNPGTLDGTVAGPRFESLQARPFTSTEGEERASDSCTALSSKTQDIPTSLEPPVEEKAASVRFNSTSPISSPSINPSARSQIDDPRLVITRYTYQSLAPWNRYCSKCQILKPRRTHHDRHTGTCVLKYDHYCPWVGHCVGARNHKFFLVFCAWAFLFCTFVCLSTTILVAIPKTGGRKIDPQSIVIIGLGAIFGLFTISLTITHSWMIAHNLTTLEQMQIAQVKHREDIKLQTVYGFFGNRNKKKETRRLWKERFGDYYTSGNIWFTQSVKKNWQQTMGSKWWMWFLPVDSDQPDDGLDYSINERFDAYGRLKRIEEWPEHLRR